MFAITCSMGALLVSIGFLFFFLYRNDWVYKKRMAILNAPNKTTREQLDDYDSLVDYDTMFWKFWIWDIEKFRKKN